VAGEEPIRLEFVKRQRCVEPGGDCAAYPCDAHHADPDTPKGRRGHDDTAIPLCRAAHQAWHDGKGPFWGWSKEMRRYWSLFQIASARQAYERWQKGNVF